MKTQLFEVTVLVQGVKRQRVGADDEDGAIRAVRDADPATLAAGPVEDQTIVGIVGVDLLPEILTVGHARLAREGRLLVARVGYQEYDLNGRFFAATWTSNGRSPRWVVEEMALGSRPSGG
jgi:hypothetical protein